VAGYMQLLSSKEKLSGLMIQRDLFLSSRKAAMPNIIEEEVSNGYEQK
jgi:hypothetical protein